MTSGFISEVFAQLFVGETADEELALQPCLLRGMQEGAKRTGVLFGEEIEALVTMLVLRLGFSQVVQFFHANLRGGDGRDELEVTVIGSGEQFAQRGQRVNGLL